MAERFTTLVAQEFKNVDLGDQRLNERCESLAKELGRSPDKSIPQACGSWGETQAAYRFFSNQKVTREAVLKAHQVCTVRRSHEAGEVLAIQDTSYLNYTSHTETEGLGPIGASRSLQGLVVHTTLAVSLQGETLGVLDQDVWARQGHQSRTESTYQRRRRDRESQCWMRALEKVRQTGLGNSVVHVMDREGDIFDVLESVVERDERFVIRAQHNRRLVEKDKRMLEVIKAQPVIGKIEVQVPARGGQRSRTAHVAVRQAGLPFRRPYVLGSGRDLLQVGIVQAQEQHPPKGCTPVSWTLLTREPIETFDDCKRVLSIYTCRWKIEEFHMGLKTGSQVEQRQLETRERLEVFLGLASVISVMLLRLRDQSRHEGSASGVLSDVQLLLLRSKVARLPRIPTLRHALRAVAQMGGFLGRKGDGEPGWRTLWRGMYDLLLMEHGYVLAKNEFTSRRQF